VSYGYDLDHRRTSVSLDGSSLASYHYLDGLLDRIDFGGAHLDFDRDDFGGETEPHVPERPHDHLRLSPDAAVAGAGPDGRGVGDRGRLRLCP